MTLHKIWQLCCGLLAACQVAAWAAPPTLAWPQRPVTLIVPFVAGGATDTFARLLVPELSAAIGQTVIIDNVAGAGGAIGTRKLIKAAPDGHVLMYGGISETVLIPQSNQSAGYQSQALQAVSILATTPLVMAVRKDFPARSLDAMVKLARASPLKYTYGSSGVGSYGHLMFEALAKQQGIQLLHVPYKGSQQLLADMASGQIDVTLTSLPSVQPFARSHLIELLGVSAAQRLADWPDLPTFSESGLRQEPLSIWGGVFAPRGLSPEIAQKVNAAFAKTLQHEGLRTQLTQLGILLEKPHSPSESQTFFEQQVRQFRPLTEAP